MDSEFWQSKKVLITGHTGFKGGWLSLWLRKLGADPVGFSLPPPTSPSFFDICELADAMVSIEGDVRDLAHLKATIEEHQPDIIIHMAAQSLVRRSYQDPLETYETNIMGTVHVLEAARLTQTARAVLIITSDKCYQNNEWVWGYRENDAIGGNDPYSSSKGCAELVTAAYQKSFFSTDAPTGRPLTIASARAGNVIGGGDWGDDRLIPDVVKAVANNTTVMIRHPNAVRPWQHVLDPLRGYLELIESMWHHHQAFAGGWNFGPGDQESRSVEWLLNQLKSQWGDQIRWAVNSPEAGGKEANLLKIDSSKAANYLGWTTRLSIQTALAWVVEWYQGYLNGLDMIELSENQISRYETLDLP